MARNRFRMLENLRNSMSDTEILDELVNALTTDLAVEHLDYIAKMHDIDSVDFEEED